MPVKIVPAYFCLCFIKTHILQGFRVIYSINNKIKRLIIGLEQLDFKGSSAFVFLVQAYDSEFD